jgi:outer membrane autotransporter protein
MMVIVLLPGAFLTVLTTNENGNYLQTAPGSCGGFGVPTSTCGYFGVDLDLKSAIADRLNVTGTANVSGAVVVNIGNAGDATPGSNTITIISAAGGETHTNLAVQAQQTAVAQYSLVYPNATDIDLKYSIDFSPVGLTQNQHSVGNAINAIQTAHVQTFRPIAAAIFYQPTVDVLGAVYNSLSGEGVAAVEQTAIAANDMFHTSILGQARFWMFDNDRNDPNSLNYYDGARMSYAAARSNGFPNYATPAKAVPAPRTWRIWTTFNGGDWRYPADTRIGTASTSTSGGGFTSGLDYQFDPTLMAGVAVGYGKAWVRIPGRETADSVEGTHVAGYAAKRFDDAYAIGSLGFDYFTNTESRYASIPGTVLPPLFGMQIPAIPGFAEHLLGEFNSYSVSGMFEAGYKYRFGDYNVTPLAGLNFTSYWMNGFTENNNGAPSFIGLSFASRNVNSVPTFVGAQIDSTQLLANGGSLYGWARATWVHEFLPHRTVNPSFIAAPGFDFVIDGALAPTDLARINLGAKVALNQSVSVSADVRADLYRTPSFAGFAGLKVAW